MMTPSATSPTAGGLLGGRDAEPDRDRHTRLLLDRRHQFGQLGGQLIPLTGDSDGGDDVDEAAGGSADRGAPLGGRRRSDHRHQRQALGGQRLADRVLFLQGQVGNDRARRPRPPPRERRTPPPPRREPCSRNTCARPGRDRRPPRRSRGPTRGSRRRRGRRCRRRGSPGRQRADPRTARRARSGRRPRPRRPRRRRATPPGPGSRPSCTASARRGPAPARRAKADGDPI